MRKSLKQQNHSKLTGIMSSKRITSRVSRGKEPYKTMATKRDAEMLFEELKKKVTTPIATKFTPVKKGWFGVEKFADAKVTVNNKNVTNISRESKQLFSNIVNNTTLNNEMRTHINKANEIINEVQTEVDKQTKIEAEINAKQENKMTGDSLVIGGNKGPVTFKLSNLAKTQIQMKVYAQQLSKLDGTAINKGVICDMIGLTNDANASAEGSATGSAGTTQGTETKTDTKIEQFADVSVVTNDESYYTEQLSDEQITQLVSNDTVNNQIMEYCENITESKKNINKNVQNLCTNLSAIAKIDQSNEFSYKDVVITDNESAVSFELLNESDQSIVQEYQDFMETMNALSTNNETESKTDATAGNSGDASAKADSKQEAKAEQKSTTESTTGISQTGGIIGIIGIVVVGIIVVVVVKSFIGKKSKNEDDDEEWNEDDDEMSAEEPAYIPNEMSAEEPAYIPDEDIEPTNY